MPTPTIPPDSDFFTFARLYDGHGFDYQSILAARLMLADRLLAACAGLGEEIENAAYRQQTRAFNEWWPTYKEDSHFADIRYSVADTIYKAWTEGISTSCPWVLAPAV